MSFRNLKLTKSHSENKPVSMNSLYKQTDRNNNIIITDISDASNIQNGIKFNHTIETSLYGVFEDYLPKYEGMHIRKPLINAELYDYNSLKIHMERKQQLKLSKTPKKNTFTSYNSCKIHYTQSNTVINCKSINFNKFKSSHSFRYL